MDLSRVPGHGRPDSDAAMRVYVILQSAAPIGCPDGVPRSPSAFAATAALVAVLTFGLAACSSDDESSQAPPTDLCSPPGLGAAAAAPTNLGAGAAAGEDRYTTPDTNRWTRSTSNALGLITPGKISVGTLSDAPPSICVDSAGQFTGYDNELLKAIACEARPAGRVRRAPSSPGCSRRSPTGASTSGSSSITTTDERRKTVGFTNGYDFGYFSLVVPNGSPITGFDDLNASTRIGVVQGTVQDDYVVNTLRLDPVKFPDYNTAYANLKTGQIDAWVAPSQQAEGAIAPGDPTSIVQNTFSLSNFVGWAVNRDNQPLIDALNSGLDAVIADGTWARLYSEWVPRELPPGWKPGSKAAPAPELPDFAALAAERGEETTPNRRRRSRRSLSSATRSSTGSCTARRSPTWSRPACRTR